MIWGDDVGWSNPSIYNRGMMGYQTPNIDKIGQEGIMFTDYYSQQSCTGGRLPLSLDNLLIEQA
jgi:arylsulfatase A-like enzyme